jgi:exopolysaccharide biosynthesis polyprenyl glycosylphosphotransferase
LGFLERQRRKRLIVGMLVATDAVALLLATFLASYIRFHNLDALAGLENITADVSYYEISAVVSLIWLGFLWSERLYDLEQLTFGAGEFARVLRALAMGVVGFILATFALKTPGLSRGWTILAFGFAVLLVSGGRFLVRQFLAWKRSRGRLLRRTVVVGSNEEAASILRMLLLNPSQGLRPIGCLASSRQDVLTLDYCSELVPGLGAARDLVQVIREHRVDTVIIASSAFDHDVLARMIAELRGVDVSIHVSSGLFEVLTSRVLVREIAGVPLVTVRAVSLSAGNLVTKRIFDIVVASAVLLVGLPLWIFVAAAIYADCPGPIFYRQRRIGQNGAEFDMLKFRSMCVDADERLRALQAVNEASGPLFKMKDDPRVTRIGKWMRKFSIDEFPQLLNVLNGDMSLVGPRPPLPVETDMYSEQDWRRMEVPPGMTGLWQVSGRSSLTFEEMVRLDLFYIENWSVGFDLSLLMRTLPAVLFARGAY